MILRRDHPLLRGCRFLWLAQQDSRATARNLLGRGAAGTVTAATAGRCGNRKALVFGGSDSVTFGAASTYGVRHGGLTVIARCRVDADNGTTGNIEGLVSAKDADATTSTGGFGLYWLKDTYTNPGFNMAVYSTGGFYYCYSTGYGGSGEYGNDRVVAGTYDPVTQQPTVYVDGIAHANRGATGIGSPETVDYDVSIGNLTLADNIGETLPLNGALAWAAVFDRVLSAAEIREWSRDDRWPFLVDDDPMHFVTSAFYSNTVGARGPYAPTGGSGIVYQTQLQALAYVGGDVVADPAVGDSALYGNSVRVGQRYTAEQAALLVRYKSLIAERNTVTIYPSVVYKNVVRVRPKRRSLIDGRTDVLSAGRYRR